MSVLHHGGSYLQRRLTKMYSDMKTSCESVTTSTAYKSVDDPEFLALKASIRTQTDRLLAWGLDWSDASAAQPNDIDESITRAGFSDVVESVMSSIQDLLNEADRLLKSNPTDSPSKESLGSVALKTHWTTEDIKRSKALVSDLTSCIDTLYDLSRSRRNMTANMSGGQQPAKNRPKLPMRRKPLKKQDDAVYSAFADSKSRHNSPIESSEGYQDIKTLPQGSFEISPLSNLHVAQVPFREQHKMEHSFTKYFLSTKRYLIDRSALQLSGPSHDMTPPPYEVVAASANSRVVGRIKTSASPLLSSTTEPTVSILVEFTPMMLETQNAITIPASQRLEKVNQSLDQLVQNGRVSHLGLLRFLGYYIDMPNARYAFIYQMPVDYFPFFRNPTDLLNEWKPRPLVSFFQTGDHQEVPNLETRLHLAYDLLMAVLHLRSQNVVHGSINSSNILIFPGLASSQNDEIRLAEDFRRPYLTSLAQFSGDGASPEPLSSSMYRHPDDKRQLEDEAAWAYDLYSLGLVLLEIGLWLPISKCWKMKYNNSMFKQRIENFYVKRLGPKCGSAYLHMVQLCLDAPNFHLSTQPMDDLGLRVPQIYHYPVLDLSEPDGMFSFSMNFLYTICKIAWACCRIDIFSAPPPEDLDDCLPLALVPASQTAAAMKQPIENTVSKRADLTSEQSTKVPFEEMRELKGKRALEDRKVKKRTIRKLTDVEIPPEHLQEWNFQLMPKLSKLLQKIFKESSEPCSATLMMTGETAEAAKTTICVTCSNVKKVRSALKRHFELNKEGWDLVVLRGDVQRSKAPRRRRRRPAKKGQESNNMTSFEQLNPCYQQRPICGASIGAFLNEEHFPPVSYGGMVLVDGIPFGMTVHHMLEAPSDSEDYEDEPSDLPSRSAAGGWFRNLPIPNASFMHNWCEDDDDLSEDNLEFEVTDDEDGDDNSVLQSLDESGDDYWLSDDYSSDEEGIDSNDKYVDEDAASVGDTSGIIPGEEPLPMVTQPAIDDVHEDFFPVPEDRDDEHLASHSLGYVYASSGVRRWTRKGIKHEIDWALLKIDDSRMEVRNIVLDKTAMTSPSGVPGESDSVTIHLNKVARMEDLGGLDVHCCGRTSGLQSGRISKALTLVKFKGRKSFSTSFCVDGNFGGKQLATHHLNLLRPLFPGQKQI